MAVLKWSREAEAGLRDIHDYIARTRPETARRTLDSIVNKVETLIKYPEQGVRDRRYPEHRVSSLRFGNFRVAYTVEEGGDVVVLGVFNGLIFLPLK